jgi:hypothetical protein
MLDGKYLVSCLFTETISIYEGRLFVYFVLNLLNPLNRDASNCVLDLFEKISRRKEASAWFHGVWTCNVEFLEY